MDRTVDAAALGAAEAAQHITLLGLFLQADIVVKAVMIMLILASFWVWAVMYGKWQTLRRMQKRAQAFEDEFWSGGSLDELFERIGNNPQHPMASVFVAAMREWRRTASRGLAFTDAMRIGLRERIDRAMNVTISREMERLESWMPFLATVGATAPFIGLFGTVWGIMNSFTAIAAMKNTNLTVVAPGIAEALFATAMGLVAAIPAVIGYNKLANDLGRYAQRLEGFAAEFGAILSRQTESSS
ncbi:MAG: protein TolQ [Alphaproteobacteria bacterium]|nr:protein TolQ [Alphaproteobacteria bacterium]